jgi:ATP-dependent Clp protease ATP-binding subunit ClpC
MTRRRLVLIAVALYPAWWRRRYGDEALAILEQTPPSARGLLDLARGAVDAWTRQRPPSQPFARFGDEARQVIVQAQLEARALEHNYVGTEHILLGLLTAGDGAATRALTNLGVSPERVRARLLEIVGQGGQAPALPSPRCRHAPSTTDLPKWSMCLTPRTKRGFELSCRAADRLGDADVEAAHLLLGLLDEGEGVGPMILAELVEPERVREQLSELRAR